MHLRRHGNLERTIMATPIPASSILDALPSEVSRGLFAQGRSVSLDAEQTLFLAGDKGDGCYRVEEGLLKASVGAPNGSERILGILGPGSVVGELSMIDGAPRPLRSRRSSAKSVSAHTEVLWRSCACPSNDTN